MTLMAYDDYNPRQTAAAATAKVNKAHSSLQPVLQTIGTIQAHHRHIFIVTGPAGCGKSTVAQTLASNLSLPYIEGDDYHTPASVEKMAHSIPLTDADRWDWLILLRDTAMSRLTAGAPGVVVTCSALKRKYRDVIRAAAYADHAVLVHFLYLRASEEVLLQRVTARAGHYMKSAMVHSQFHDLEEPGNQEQNLDVLVVDVEHNDIKEVSRLAVDAVTKVLVEDSQPTS